ncbi:MAG: ankyrin repeat domain-containing protein, partial [Sphingobacteriales bacterium]
LLSKGADVKVADKTGDNLVAYLVQSYNPTRAEEFDAKLKLLQDKGLDVKAAQKNGNTLYHLAVAKNDLSLVKKLEPLQIDVNSKNKEGITALHKAAMVSKDDAMLKYLLSIGAKKDIATNFKETAFDLASENESLAKSNVSVNFLK